MNTSKLYFVGLCFTALNVSAQVGVNTTSPKSTFDISAKRDSSGNITDNSQIVGLQAPRLTRAELTNLTSAYGVNQTGALAYITDISAGNANAGSPRENINSIGYYYFDGTKWQKITNLSDASYTASNGLTMSGKNTKLGGSLVENTTVTQGTNTMAFTSSATTGDGTGTSHFTVDGTTLNVDAANNRLGIGTSSPSVKLDIATGGTSAAPVDGFKLVDGRQKDGYILTSDNTGVGSWKPAGVLNIPIAKPSSNYIHASGNSTTTKYTGMTVTLPPGKWVVNIIVGLTLDPATTYTTGSNFIRFRLLDNTTDANAPAGTFSSDAITPRLASGGYSLSATKVMLNGSLGINNTSGADKTYYLHVDNVADATRQFEVMFNYAETFFYYYPLK